MDTFSSFLFAYECLFDKKRTLFFRKEISATVKSGDIVLDSGSGTGVLSMFAASAGAKKIIAVEIAPDLAIAAHRNISANNIHNVRILNKDITKLKKLPLLDVVIMEMLDTGLVAEQQTQAFNNLLSIGAIHERTKVIPSGVKSYLQLISYDFRFYNYRFNTVIQARNYAVIRNIKVRLSNTVEFDNVTFNRRIKILVNKYGRFRILHSGVVNAVLLTSRVVGYSRDTIGSTSDMNMPVIIPINSRSVVKGSNVDFGISYMRGNGFQKLHLELS